MLHKEINSFFREYKNAAQNSFWGPGLRLPTQYKTLGIREKSDPHNKYPRSYLLRIHIDESSITRKALLSVKHNSMSIPLAIRILYEIKEDINAPSPTPTYVPFLLSPLILYILNSACTKNPRSLSPPFLREEKERKRKKKASHDSINGVIYPNV